MGREAINIILERTKKGLDKNGVPFHPYSPDYIASDDFKLAEKSKNRVDLRMTSDMLENLSIMYAGEGKSGDSVVILGFPDEHQRAKANGHITGQQGRGPLPKRDFLGISKDELSSILTKIPPPEKLGKAELLSKIVISEIFKEIEETLVKTEVL